MAKQSFSFPAESHVASGEYDPADEKKGIPSKLVIQFKGGGTYEYEGVPQEIVDHIKEAPSPGKVLNAEVKGRFGYTKLD